MDQSAASTISANKDKHLTAALDWITQAWTATNRQGISAGYDLLRRRWKAAYPETTGYLIPTLLDCARETGVGQHIDTARQLAEYEINIQNADGSIPSMEGEPTVFDTGQVIFGWTRLWKLSGEARLMDAALRAADWLVSVQSDHGPWTHFQHIDLVKVIDARVAWSLLEVERITGKSKYGQSARRNLDWVISQQHPNGWFDNCALRPGQWPVTHTLAYTVEGLFESGSLCGDGEYVQAAIKTADAILARQRPDGSLGGAFDSNLNSSRWSCLTGNVQFALIWLRLYDLIGDAKYRDGALRAIEFVRKKQDLRSSNPGVRGGIPGSAPIWAPYERLKYPNWACKFYIDALLLEKRKC